MKHGGCNMSWFSNIFSSGPQGYKDFQENYPKAMEWYYKNAPHKIAIRRFKDKKGRWRNQIIDESPNRIDNRRVLCITTGGGYETAWEADEISELIFHRDERRIQPRIMTDRRGRYRYRLAYIFDNGKSGILMNTSGAGFDTEEEARQVMTRILFADRRIVREG